MSHNISKNIPLDMNAQQDSLFSIVLAKDAKFLHTENKDLRLHSLHWALRPEDTVSNAAVHILTRAQLFKTSLA